MMKMNFQKLKFRNWEIQLHLCVEGNAFKCNFFKNLTVLLEGGKGNLRSRVTTDLIESMNLRRPSKLQST